MEEIILVILSQVIEGLVTQYVKYEIQRKVDMIGNSISQIVAVFDDDGDGVADREEVMCSFDVSIPDLSNGYCSLLIPLKFLKCLTVQLPGMAMIIISVMMYTYRLTLILILTVCRIGAG